MSKPLDNLTVPGAEGSPPEAEPADDPFAAEVTRRVTALIGQERAAQVVSQIIALRREEEFFGPIAHPRHLREYETLVPGAANRIIRMAEETLDHQKMMQKRALEADVEDMRAGRRYGFLALMVLLACALICGLTGREWLAVAFLGAGAIGTIGIFVRGRTNKT